MKNTLTTISFGTEYFIELNVFVALAIPPKRQVFDIMLQLQRRGHTE